MAGEASAFFFVFRSVQSRDLPCEKRLQFSAAMRRAAFDEEMRFLYGQ